MVCEEVAKAMGNTRDVVWKYYYAGKEELAASAGERDRERKRAAEAAPALPAVTTEGRMFRPQHLLTGEEL